MVTGQCGRLWLMSSLSSKLLTDQAESRRLEYVVIQVQR